ncbi:MAG: PD-(D/E)XK nuclease family protein, partial [Firmicutes bacterium]|nr:PD-(D/E)XK nuclease family protein [Bacillota bacterium]
FRTERDGRGIMVQGTIDCCFIEDGSWVLVDYKSNYVDYMNLDDAFEHLKESYIPQLALYREALEKITGIPVKEAVLYLFSIGQELRIE